MPLIELARWQAQARPPFQGLMLIDDRCDRGWAQAQVKKCRVIALAPEGRGTCRAVLDPEREGKRRLGIRIPRFHWLSALDAPGFSDFVQAVAWADDQDDKRHDLIPKRQTWIQVLEQGRNPFDAETLTRLREEEF